MEYKKFLMNNILYKIGLGLAAALLLCLLPMPYGYYTLIRFVVMVIFGCLAFNFYKKDKMSLFVLACSIAILFQPFFKLALGRIIWNVVDVIVAIVLILLWYKNNKITH